MSRKEIVLLVSRAIALLQIIVALVDAVTTLPQQGYLLVREMALLASMPAFRGMASRALPAASLSPILWVNLLSTALRIVILLFIAALFWNCGPTVERWLMPSAVEQEAQT